MLASNDCDPGNNRSYTDDGKTGYYSVHPVSGEGVYYDKNDNVAYSTDAYINQFTDDFTVVKEEYSSPKALQNVVDDDSLLGIYVIEREGSPTIIQGETIKIQNYENITGVAVVESSAGNVGYREISSGPLTKRTTEKEVSYPWFGPEYKIETFNFSDVYVSEIPKTDASISDRNEVAESALQNPSDDGNSSIPKTEDGSNAVTPRTKTDEVVGPIIGNNYTFGVKAGWAQIISVWPSAEVTYNGTEGLAINEERYMPRAGYGYNDTYSFSEGRRESVRSCGDNQTETVYEEIEKTTVTTDRSYIIPDGDWKDDGLQPLVLGGNATTSETTVTIQYTHSIDYTLTYGVASSDCRSAPTSNTKSGTLSVTYSATTPPLFPAEADPNPSNPIEVTFVKTPGPRNQLVIDTGDRRHIAENAIDTIKLEYEFGRSETFYGGWQITPVEQNYFDRAGQTNLTNTFSSEYPQAYQGYATFEGDDITGGNNYISEGQQVAIPTPSGVAGMGNNGTLAETAVLQLPYIIDEESQVTVTATGMTNEKMAVERKYIEYKQTDIKMNRKSNGTVVMRLVGPNGDGLSGRTLKLNNAADEKVTTNSTGYATTKIKGLAVVATFEGDNVTANRSSYYWRSRGVQEGPDPVLKELKGVFTLATYSINWMMVFAEWLALGIFALWWLKFHRQ